MTKTSKVLTALMNGQELTSKQIAARFNVGSPTKVISELRKDGHPIYLNRKVDTKGRETSKYRIGTPSRSMVAFAAAAGFFG